MLEFATSKLKNSMFLKEKNSMFFLWDCVSVLVAQLCITLYSPMDCTLLSASSNRILE